MPKYSLYATRLKENSNTSLIIRNPKHKRTVERFGIDSPHTRSQTPIKSALLSDNDDVDSIQSENILKKGFRYIERTNHLYNFENNFEAFKDVLVLVPIKLDYEFENYRLNDCFLWNLNEKLVTPINFIEILTNDLDLPRACFSSLCESISNAIEAYKQIKEFEKTYKFPEKFEMLVEYTTVEFDIQVDQLHFTDKIQWDPNTNYQPQEYAKIIGKELGLSGEILNIITYQIADTLYQYKRDKAEIKEVLMLKLAYEAWENNTVQLIKEMLKIRHAYSDNKFIASINMENAIVLSESPTNNNIHQKPNIFRPFEEFGWAPEISFLSKEESERRLLVSERKSRRRRRDPNKRF